MKNTLAFSLSACALLFLTLRSTILYAAAPHEPGQSLIKIEGKCLYVQARKVPLQSVLSVIAQKSGIEILFQRPATERLTAELTCVPIEKGLKRLLRSYNHAFVYGHDDQDDIVIKKLIVYSQIDQRDVSPNADGNFGSTTPLDSHRATNGIRINPSNPAIEDPLESMAAIDPLMRLNGVEAPYLPPDFHNDMMGATPP